MALDWREEGRKAFVFSQVREGKPYPNYPTQDVHTPAEEREFIDGWTAAKEEWGRSGGLSGLQAYIREIEEEAEREEAEKV